MGGKDLVGNELKGSPEFYLGASVTPGLINSPAIFIPSDTQFSFPTALNLSICSSGTNIPGTQC